MRTISILILLIIIGALCSVGGFTYGQMSIHETKQKITLFCGSASKVPGEELAVFFTEATGINVEIHWGGSGKVLAEMETAKTGDLYIPGSQDYMAIAIEKNLVDPKSVRIIAYLVPAIIVPKGNPANIKSLEDLAKPGVKVGIGNPDYVCVGKYAKEILEYNGLWEKVKPNITIYAESCSKTAALVVTGTVDAIIGWHVFHYWNPEKTDIIWLKPKEVPKVDYPAGPITVYAKNRKLAELYLDFLSSETAKQTFSKYGYIVDIEELKTYAPQAEVPKKGFI
jgi:molybdate transport system substrate-binding protein